MSRSQKLIVTVVHCLPGRVRMRLSRDPLDADRLSAAVRDHPGLREITYTPVSRSLLVRFDPHDISREEITLRVAFQLSVDQGGQSVRLLAAPEQTVIEDSAAVAAIALATALGMRWLGRSSGRPSWLDWTAGLGTAWSIVDHAAKELKERGYFDPEVLTLAYLVTALAKGNFLTASAVTWLSTFGRHLIEVPPTGVEVHGVEVPGDNGRGPRHELVVGPDTETPDHMRLLGAIQGVLKYAMSGGGRHGVQSLWEELKNVSQIHGQMLEGYGRAADGIPIRFN